MTIRQAKILLAALISVRASGYLFSKLLLQGMGTFTLLALRFLTAFVLLAIIFHKHFANMTRKAFLWGMAIGVAFFATMAFELLALTQTSSSNVAFLENTAIVLVPLGEALLVRRLPQGRILASALCALCGVGLLTLGGSEGLGLGLGEALAMGAATCYAAAMMITARASQHEDVLLLGILQVGWIGGLGLVCSLLFETPALPASPTAWLYLGILVVVCTGFGFTLQPAAQKPLAPETVGLMCALSPLVASVLGVIILGETFTLQGYAGMALILASIAVSALGNKKAAPRDAAVNAGVEVPEC